MMQLIYRLLAGIDTIIYSLASSMFRIIFDLANTQFFKEEQITSIANRVYIVVGVLMLFKLVISGVQYLINPEVFDDKDKGLVGILKKSAISLVLIVFVPTIFRFLILAQEPIIRTLPSIILGNEASERVTDESLGFDLSFQVLSSFVKVRDGKPGSVGTSGEIHDFFSFNQHVMDGCPPFTFFGAISTDGCHYDYMIIISTLCGGFLCYMLLTMMLDIAIRTIKFGVIQILAPIPISSYIVSKDKLNKFVKTAMTVYVDLFIRMAIVYFIIFALKAMIVENEVLNVFSINEGGVSDTGDWFRGVIVNICIIFGLLQFASKAPKFITELLGLPDVGSGDFADMFKPAWQRAGGAAGALINPARNAISNYKSAMTNNTDMGSTLRRRINASRRAIGGFGRGALDAALGVMAGDDWAKIGQRHDASVRKSTLRSAANYMKRTDKNEANQQNEDIIRRRGEIKEFLQKSGIDPNNIRTGLRKTAESAYNSHMADLNTNISNLQQKLAAGTITDAERATLNSNIEEYSRLSTKDGKKDFISSKINEYAGETANDLYTQEVNSRNARKADIATEIAEARNRYLNATNEKDKERAQQEILALTAEQDEIDRFLARDAAKVKKELTEYIKTGTLKTVEPNISTGSIISGKVDKFFGGEGFTGQGFIDTADLLKNNRSNLYTGEAMTKMRQNADILIKDDGTPARFTSSFATDTSREYTYAEIADLKRKADAGVTIDWTTEGFENAAMLQSAFEDIEKKAAEAYVTANIAASDPTVRSNFKLKRGQANTTIVEGIKRLKAQIASANIPKEERDRLLKELSENPGEFFKRASDIQETMRTRGSRISAYNSGKKDG